MATIKINADASAMHRTLNRLEKAFEVIAQRYGLTRDDIDAIFQEADREFDANKTVGKSETASRRVAQEANKAGAAAKGAGDTIEKESQQGETAVEETT